MKKIILFFLGILCAAQSFGQQKMLQGKIIDASTQEPLAGARIELGNKTTSSDKNGVFSLPCQPGKSLQVSFLGYQKAEKQIPNCTSFQEIGLQPQTDNLDEVQLTGFREIGKQKLHKARQQITLEPKELNRNTGLFLDDAINANVPGVTMERRAVSSGQQFNIRGYGNGVGFRGASNNFDGQGYKVYLNNIPITDAEGITQLDDIDFASLGKVDIIKGPAGSRYGLAIAGVINLETQQPQPGETRIQEKLTTGSYGLFRTTTQLQMGSQNMGLLVNYGHQTSDGFMAHTHSNKDFFNLNANFKPSEKQQISAYLGYSDSYDERGGELSIEQYENKDYSGNARYIKNNAHSEVISFRAGLSHTYRFKPWLANITSVFGSGSNTNSSSAGGWTDKDPVNYGLRSVFQFQFNLNENFALQGSAGVELQQQRAAILGYNMVENPENPEAYNQIGPIKSNQFAKTGNSLLFTEWTLQMPANFSLTAGISASAMKIDLENRLYNPESTAPRNVSAHYKELYSPHIAVNKVFNENSSVYASYSKAYNAPVSGNIVLPLSGTLNTGLVPEVGNQFEIGTKGKLFNNKLNYQLAYFDTRFKNKFTSVAVPLDENTTAYTYIANGGSQEHRGVEFLADYSLYSSSLNFFTEIHPYANLTYSHFRYKDFQYERLNGDNQRVIEDYSGNEVAGAAPWVANAGLDVQTRPGIYGNVNFSYRDAMPFTSDNQNYTDAYSLLNAKIGYENDFGRFRLNAFFGAKNLTGTQYYYMVFLNQLPDAYLPAPYELNFYGGLNLSYRL